jgi:hypothetical protein
VAFRYISGSSYCTLEPLSLSLTYALRALKTDIERPWFEAQKKYEIENPLPPWITTDATQVRPVFQRLNDDLANGDVTLHDPNNPIQTKDFSTLYTKIELDELKLKMSALFKMAYDSHKTEGERTRKITLIVSEKNTPHWCSKNQLKSKTLKLKKGEVAYTLEKLIRCFNYLIDHTYVRVGDRVYKQAIGIAMGTNAAVFIANYFLYSFELKFLKRILRNRNHQDITKNTQRTHEHFAYTKRFVDDLLTINNPSFAQHTIYPEYLQLNDEHQGTTAPFLDLQITMSGTTHPSISSTVFDKRTSKKFSKLSFIKYPHINSFLPDQHKYNIVTSQLFRFSRRCTLRRGFVFNTARFLFELAHTKSYSKRRLFSKTLSFLKRFPSLYDASPKHIFFLVRRRLDLILLSPFHRAHLYSSVHTNIL